MASILHPIHCLAKREVTVFPGFESDMVSWLPLNNRTFTDGHIKWHFQKALALLCCWEPGAQYKKNKTERGTQGAPSHPATRPPGCFVFLLSINAGRD